MIQVRQGNINDIPFIVDFQQKMARETEEMQLDIGNLTKGVEAVFENKNKGQYIIAEHEGKIIACLMLTPEWSDWRNTNFLWIQSVYVINKYRKQGVFRKMYDFTKKTVEASKDFSGLRLYVEINNLSAQKAYISLGMDGEHFKMFEWEKSDNPKPANRV